MTPELRKVYLRAQGFKSWMEQQPDKIDKAKLRIEIEKIFQVFIDSEPKTKKKTSCAAALDCNYFARGMSIADVKTGSIL